MFLNFTHFYCSFIWGFNKTAAPLTSILNIIKLFDISALIVIEANIDKVVNKSDLKTSLSKSKKINFTKFKIFA